MPWKRGRRCADAMANRGSQRRSAGGGERPDQVRERRIWVELFEENQGHFSKSYFRESDYGNMDDMYCGLIVNSEIDSLPDPKNQVTWLKVELCRLLEERRSAVLS